MIVSTFVSHHANGQYLDREKKEGKNMALVKLKDVYPHMAAEGSSIIGLTIYTNKDEKVGTVKDILVDEGTKKFRYLIVDIGFWILGKEVLLPIEIAQVRTTERRVDVEGLTKEQAKKNT